MIFNRFALTKQLHLAEVELLRKLISPWRDIQRIS